MRHAGTCVIFAKSVESVGTGTQVTAVTMRLCKDPHRVQSAGAVLGHREVILISLLLLHSVLPPRWPSCLIPPSVSTTGGSREWGRQVTKIPFFANKISLCTLCWKCKRTKLSFIQFKVLFLTLISEALKAFKVS